MAELTATATGQAGLPEGSRRLAVFGEKGIDPAIANQYLAWAQRSNFTLRTIGNQLWAVPIHLPGSGKKDEDYFEQYKVPILAAVAIVFIILLMKA